MEKMSFERWNTLRGSVSQDIVLIGDNGKQTYAEMKCPTIKMDTGNHLFFPRAVFMKEQKYVLLKFLEKQNRVIYLIKTEE